MKKFIFIIILGISAAFAFAYTALGQSSESLDRMKQAQALIDLYEKTEKAISLIERDRARPAVLKVYDIKDLMEENAIKDYAPPSPFVYNVEQAGIVEFEDVENYEEYFGPDEIIELIRSNTGDENWPYEADGMGTIEYHRGKLIVINTPDMLEKVEAFLERLHNNLPPLISSTVYLLAADEDYLREHRRDDSSVITPQAVEKMLSDAGSGGKVEVIRTGYLTAYSSQAAYLHCGAHHTYIGNTDTASSAGMTPVTIYDPIINIFREGFIVGLRTQYLKETDTINVVAMVSLSRLTGIEEHSITDSTISGQAAKTYKVETPEVDLQIVSGSSDIPKGYGLLLGGSKMKTTQSSQKSFLVLVVPTVLK